ncbi:MAG TPA: transposase [Acidiferrobacter sp.]|nr:transposase [Acidiferrobacter sp.]
MLDTLREAFTEILEGWRCTLLEFGGEADHVHLLAEIHPALNISTLINNLKTASSRRARNPRPLLDAAQCGPLGRRRRLRGCGRWACGPVI